MKLFRVPTKAVAGRKLIAECRQPLSFTRSLDDPILRMVESDHPDNRLPIDMLSLRRFLVRAQREVRLDGEVNVRITSDEEMRRLNREFRRKDKPTDVLSFPSSLNGNSDLAGDIAISAEIAYANAGALGHPFEEELKVLMLHGLLHLAGHDHESDHGEMAKLERRLRAKLKLPAALIERNEIRKPARRRS